MDITQRWLKAFHGLNCLYSSNAAALFILHVGSCPVWKGTFLVLWRAEPHRLPRSCWQDWGLAPEPKAELCSISRCQFTSGKDLVFCLQRITTWKLHRHFSVSTISWLCNLRLGTTSGIPQRTELLSCAIRKHRLPIILQLESVNIKNINTLITIHIYTKHSSSNYTGCSAYSM